MGNNIYPLAFKLAPGTTRTLYYLGFPQTWKTQLLEIARKNNVRFKDEHGLPTNALKKLVDSWMDGIVALAPLKKDSHDECWLTSLQEYSEKDIQALCNIIKVWVMGTYAVSKKATPLVKELSKRFCEMIKPEDIAVLKKSAEVCLTLEDGTVRDEAYQAIPLLITNRLLGQEFELNGQALLLSYAAKNQLISQPITDPKSHHQYSYVFDLTVQTTPPHRKAMLLCHTSIRRWIPHCLSQDGNPYLKEKINAHIQIGPNKYCKIPIAYDKTTKRIDWMSQDKECYNIWGYEQLPEVEMVFKDLSSHRTRILLPYKNGMKGFAESRIGTGVPVVDKAAIHQSLSNLLVDLVGGRLEAKQLRAQKQTFECFDSPQKYANSEEFRSWVKKCTETDHITFEIYGLWQDSAQQNLLSQIQGKIEEDFGEETETSCLKIQCVRKEAGSLAEYMKKDDKDTKILRCEEIVKQLGITDEVTACIFALPWNRDESMGDPKLVLRNAFARTGRVVQFIVPNEDIDQNRIEHTVYDLYRQLGVIAMLDLQKGYPLLAGTPCVGMHLCTQVPGMTQKARFLPIYVMVDVLEGKTRVHCDAFSNRVVSYREACLEMAKLYWKSDLEQIGIEVSRSPAKSKLIELRNKYYQKDDRVLLLIQADGNTRALWSGISDKEIGGYSMIDEFCPEQINAGMPQSPYQISLNESGVRIIRIRSNQEIPDYFTDLSRKATDEHLQYASASGIFKYENVFWGVHTRPYDFQYLRSFTESRIDHPTQRYAEKDMIELYPIQLQSGDDASSWVFYANALRHIPIQYNQSTVLPLPLHLAKGLEEYLFDA